MKKYGNFNIFALIVGFSFLYIPIILLILFSFNESRLVTVWGGFSTKWYGELMNNQGIKDAAWVTFKVAFVSSTVATFLGTIAGLVMSRFGKFGGRTLFSGMIYAPMVMPEVILGLSILLTFITLSIDRGVLTVTLAHITFRCAMSRSSSSLECQVMMRVLMRLRLTWAAHHFERFF